METVFKVLLALMIGINAPNVSVPNQVPYQVTVQNLPENITQTCPDFLDFVYSIPQQLTPTVSWSGEIVMRSDEANYAFWDAQFDSSGKYKSVVINRVELTSVKNCQDLLAVTYKEIIAHAISFNWLNHHPDYYSNPREYVALVDGLAILYMGERMDAYFGMTSTNRFVKWDGVSYPNCEQLVQIVWLGASSYDGGVDVIAGHLDNYFLKTHNCDYLD